MVALGVKSKDGGVGGGVCILFLPKRPQKRYILKKKNSQKLKVAGCLARRMGWWRWGEWKIGAPIQEGGAKHNRFNFNNWKEIEKKKWHQYKGGQRRQWQIGHQDIIYISLNLNGEIADQCRGPSMNGRDHLLSVGWPTNQDNKRANSVHLTPCNSHLDELTNIYKCKTWASDAVTWYTQVRKEGTLSLIWHPINIVQIEYPRWEVHQLLSGYHWRSAHERLIFNPNLHLSPMAFPRGIFDLDVKSHRISFNFYRW